MIQHQSWKNLILLAMRIDIIEEHSHESQHIQDFALFATFMHLKHFEKHELTDSDIYHVMLEYNVEQSICCYYCGNETLIIEYEPICTFCNYQRALHYKSEDY